LAHFCKPIVNYYIIVTGGNITYSIPSGVGDDKFAVDPHGVVRLKGALDREERDHYTVPIYAVEGEARYDTALLHVNVLDVNDHAPQFKPGTCYPLAVPENSDFAVIHTVVASDADIGTNGDITYSITGEI
jgi:protocadherin-16/23